ncbi:MAG: hypothetical protein ACFFFB_01575 [Candidatus Heimdallarchaeota archaeon]
MQRKAAENLDPKMILDYYKNWDSDRAPVMISLDYFDSSEGKIEIEDQRRIGYLRSKYSKKK